MFENQIVEIWDSDERPWDNRDTADDTKMTTALIDILRLTSASSSLSIHLSTCNSKGKS